MHKYTLTILRTSYDIGKVTIEAESPEDAERKYFHPKVDEDVVFDDMIDWDWQWDNNEYTITNIEEEY